MSERRYWRKTWRCTSRFTRTMNREQPPPGEWWGLSFIYAKCKQIVNTKKVGSAFFAKICYGGNKDTARPRFGARKGGAGRGKGRKKEQG